MKQFVRVLLFFFGWVPVPSFTLRLLPRKYKRRLARNFLEASDSEGLLSEVVSIVLERVEERYDPRTSSRFESAKAEVDAALEEVPQLEPYRVYFLRQCERKRREFGLPV